MDMRDHVVTVEQEIEKVFMGRPHLLLLGAGASKAALPNGDKHGRPVPLLKEVAESLSLVDDFPNDLKELSVEDFEGAYSRLHSLGPSPELDSINAKVHEFFSQLELPDEPNLYDAINLSLRGKDAIATFNWDPFLMQSRIRLAKQGITTSFPHLYFLHGNVTVGYCEKDKVCGINGSRCSKCGNTFTPSNLLYPIEKKDYNTDVFIRNEWSAVGEYLDGCSMFTVFGYSAPVTDKEAVDLLKKGWGSVEKRELEQTEIIARPGSDHDTLHKTWRPFIHTHHYHIIENFYDSFLAHHPRRSIEAYWNQNLEAKFISSHQIPASFKTLEEMGEWFKPLIDAEIAAEIRKATEA